MSRFNVRTFHLNEGMRLIGVWAFLVLSAFPITTMLKGAWENGGLLRALATGGMSTTGLGPGKVILFIIGFFIIYMLLLFLDPIKRIPAIMIGIVGGVWLWLFTQDGIIASNLWQIVLALETEWGSFVGGVCVALLSVTIHSEPVTGNLVMWDRDRVAKVIAASAILTTSLAFIDYHILNMSGVGPSLYLHLVALVVFAILIYRLLSYNVSHSVAVLGGTRMGKTTFALGLYNARLESQENVPNGTKPLRALHTETQDSKDGEWGEATIEGRNISPGEPTHMTNYYRLGYRDLYGRFLKYYMEVEMLDYGGENYLGLADKMKEFDKWYVRWTDRLRALLSQYPYRYRKFKEAVSIVRDIIRNGALHTILTQNNEVQKSNQWQTIDGSNHRHVSTLVQDLEEYGICDDANLVQNILLYKIRFSDTILFLFDAGYLSEDNYSSPPTKKPGLNSYVDETVELFNSLGKNTRVREILIVITKSDRLISDYLEHSENDPESVGDFDPAKNDEDFEELKNFVVESFETNPQIQDLRANINYDGIYPVFFEMVNKRNKPPLPSEGETSRISQELGSIDETSPDMSESIEADVGPVSPLNTRGFKDVLDKLKF